MRQDRLSGMESYIDGLAVRRGFCDKLCGDRSPAAGAVLDNGCLSDSFSRCAMFARRYRRRRPAGRHDDPDRLRWIALRKRG